MFNQENFNEFYGEFLKKRTKDSDYIAHQLGAANDFHDYLAKKGIKSINDIIRQELNAYIEEKQAQGEDTKQINNLFGYYSQFAEAVVRSGMFYKKGIIPEVITFQTQHGEFYFLGKEYDRNADMGKVWDDFIKTGGYEKNKAIFARP